MVHYTTRMHTDTGGAVKPIVALVDTAWLTQEAVYILMIPVATATTASTLDALVKKRL